MCQEYFGNTKPGVVLIFKWKSGKSQIAKAILSCRGGDFGGPTVVYFFVCHGLVTSLQRQFLLIFVEKSCYLITSNSYLCLHAY